MNLELVRFSILLIVGFVASLMLGCDRPESPPATDHQIASWIGETVRVQFRRDALGAASTLPIPPNTSSMNGADTVLIGELMEVQASSIVIRDDDRLKWIPRDVILFVQAPVKRRG